MIIWLHHSTIICSLLNTELITVLSVPARVMIIGALFVVWADNCSKTTINYSAPYASLAFVAAQLIYILMTSSKCIAYYCHFKYWADTRFFSCLLYLSNLLVFRSWADNYIAERRHFNYFIFWWHLQKCISFWLICSPLAKKKTGGRGNVLAPGMSGGIVRGSTRGDCPGGMSYNLARTQHILDSYETNRPTHNVKG